MSEVDTSEFEEPVVDRTRQERDEYKRQRDQIQKAMTELEARYDLLSTIDMVRAGPPKWTLPKRRQDANHGIAELMLSDLHLDEVIAPAAMNGVNAYNRKIAQLRLRRCVEKFVSVARDHISGITYDGACVYLNGDVFSGLIHEELRGTNETPMAASFDFWVTPLRDALKAVADEFGSLQVVVRVGNHGRESPNKIYKGAVESNWDWLLGRTLYRELCSDPRISWDIPLSTRGVVQHYGTRYLVKHGNDSRGGSGISGLLTPLSLNEHRSRKVQQAVDAPFDLMLLGHWHQYLVTPGYIVNGSLKGYDEFAQEHNFGFEVPQQAFWVTTPEHGPSFHVPIRPMDRKREDW